MGNVVVDVMLKSEILDPQGQAVAGALPRFGFDQFTDVRQGKRFVLTVDGEVTDEVLAAAREAAEKLLSNPVIEDVVSVHPRGAAGMRIGVVTFPGTLDDHDAAARGARSPAGSRSPLWHGDADLHGRRRGHPARRLLLRRLPALRGHRPLRARHGRDHPGGPGRPAGPRHLQRLPGPVRVAPAARRADPQRPPQVQLQGPGAAGRERLDRLDVRLRPTGEEITIVLKNGEGGFVADERTLDELEGEGRVVFRYVRATATPTAPTATSPASPTSAATSSA